MCDNTVNLMMVLEHPSVKKTRRYAERLLAFRFFHEKHNQNSGDKRSRRGALRRADDAFRGYNHFKRNAVPPGGGSHHSARSHAIHNLGAGGGLRAQQLCFGFRPARHHPRLAHHSRRGVSHKQNQKAVACRPSARAAQRGVYAAYLDDFIQRHRLLGQRRQHAADAGGGYLRHRHAAVLHNEKICNAARRSPRRRTQKPTSGQPLTVDGTSRLSLQNFRQRKAAHNQQKQSQRLCFF